MPQNAAVLETARILMVSGAGTAASAVSLGMQLNAPHAFLNLQLPYWFFLLSMVALVFFGAFLSLKTDYMRSQGTPVGNFFTALLVGFVISFVILPAIKSEPSIGLMQITAFVSGLCGTVLLRVVLQVMNDEELRESLVKSITRFIGKWVTRIFGGDK